MFRGAGELPKSLRPSSARKTLLALRSATVGQGLILWCPLCMQPPCLGRVPRKEASSSQCFRQSFAELFPSVLGNIPQSRNTLWLRTSCFHAKINVLVSFSFLRLVFFLPFASTRPISPRSWSLLEYAASLSPSQANERPTQCGPRGDFLGLWGKDKEKK